jgi:nitroreductase
MSLSPNEAALRLLETRRSVPTSQLVEPAPSEAELARILTIAARVPDHGSLTPWRFIVFSGDARHQVGQRLSATYRLEKQDMPPERLEKFAGIMTRVFTYAPLVILIVSSPAPDAKIALREQELSAGAVAMNLLNATHASGYGAILLTGWAAESRGAADIYGLAPHEHIAGIVHIGTPTDIPADRARPKLADLVTHWTTPE